MPSIRMRTALMDAAAEGYSKGVKRLLRTGADVAQQDAKGWCALHFAVSSGAGRSVLERLLRHGARADAADDALWTPTHEAAWGGGYLVLDELLTLALHVSEGDPAYWLDARDKDGWTPLHSAAYKGNDECALALLERGADPAIRDVSGQSAADVASQCEHAELAALIDDWSVTWSASEEDSEPEPPPPVLDRISTALSSIEDAFTAAGPDRHGTARNGTELLFEEETAPVERAQDRELREMEAQRGGESPPPGAAAGGAAARLTAAELKKKKKVALSKPGKGFAKSVFKSVTKAIAGPNPVGGASAPLPGEAALAGTDDSAHSESASDDGGVRSDYSAEDVEHGPGAMEDVGRGDAGIRRLAPVVLSAPPVSEARRQPPPPRRQQPPPPQRRPPAPERAELEREQDLSSACSGPSEPESNLEARRRRHRARRSRGQFRNESTSGQGYAQSDSESQSDGEGRPAAAAAQRPVDVAPAAAPAAAADSTGHSSSHSPARRSRGQFQATKSKAAMTKSKASSERRVHADEYLDVALFLYRQLLARIDQALGTAGAGPLAMELQFQPPLGEEQQTVAEIAALTQSTLQEALAFSEEAQNFNQKYKEASASADYITANYEAIFSIE